MGKYDIDFSKQIIVVDGHDCVMTQYPGIYEVQDEYFVSDMDEWCYDKNNENLKALFILKDEEKVSGVIKFICKWSNSEVKRFISDYELKGVNLSNFNCIYSDGVVPMGGAYIYGRF